MLGYWHRATIIQRRSKPISERMMAYTDPRARRSSDGQRTYAVTPTTDIPPCQVPPEAECDRHPQAVQPKPLAGSQNYIA